MERHATAKRKKPAGRRSSSRAAVPVRKTVDPLPAELRAIDEVLRIAKNVQQGNLAERARLEGFEGRCHTLLENINTILDSVVAPILETRDVLQKLAVNDCSQPVLGQYAGAFAELAAAANLAQRRMTHVVEVVKNVSKGDLKDLPELKQKGRRSEHDELGPSFIALLENLGALLAEMNHMSEEHNKGDIDVAIPLDRFEGEFRRMAQGVNDMVAAHLSVTNKTMTCIAEFGKGKFNAPLERFPGKKAFINETIEQMRANLKALIFETAQNTSALAASSEELTAVSQQMSSNAEATATQASVVSAASEQISRNVASVASAAEQMQASIREIARNSTDSARVARNAVTMAESTNDTMKKLGDSSQEIGNVVKVITSIAQQTNLLALNATIEAARAGEAGKGFAVVANEVKELAKQTARATEEISKKIEAIQGDAQGAVTAIEEIGAIINQINDISNSIASAVEEQTVTTNEIGRSVSEAAKGVSDIAKNISGVALAARNTTQGANETQNAAQELSRMAAKLQSALSRFTI